MERWATVSSNKRTHSCVRFVQQGQPLASPTARHSECPHEEETWPHIRMLKRYWTLVPHINRKVSHNDNKTCKEMMTLLRHEAYLREEDGACLLARRHCIIFMKTASKWLDDLKYWTNKARYEVIMKTTSAHFCTNEQYKGIAHFASSIFTCGCVRQGRQATYTLFGSEPIKGSHVSKRGLLGGAEGENTTCTHSFSLTRTQQLGLQFYHNGPRGMFTKKLNVERRLSVSQIKSDPPPSPLPLHEAEGNLCKNLLRVTQGTIAGKGQKLSQDTLHILMREAINLLCNRPENITGFHS